MLLSPIYNHDFYEFSHGSREGHSQHQALQEIRQKCLNLKINWILDANVSGFFDNIDHTYIFLTMRIVNEKNVLLVYEYWSFLKTSREKNYPLMNRKFEVDKITLGKTVYCQKDFVCLDGDLPETRVAVTGGETVLCLFKQIDFFCEYEVDPACMCPVRSEIYKKYASHI